MKNAHTPVFLTEAIDALDVQMGKKYIDATYGEGGHSKEIVKRGGQLLSIDADAAQVDKSINSLKVIHGNFADIEQIAQSQSFVPVAGILFDFGLSMGQIRNGRKGFSFEQREDPLDMRLNESGMTVAEYLQKTDGETLKYELMKYSEDIYSPKIAQKIVQNRSDHPLKTVSDLVTVIDSVVKADPTTKKKSYARIFQALRIIVNDEMENLKKGLQGALNITQQNGKIVIITFHSLEDRLVKSFARSCDQVSEIVVNVEKMRRLASFERSAVLRVLTKL